MIQNPLQTDASNPEPDARVVRGKPRDYSNRKPLSCDVALAVEVSDSTLSHDRGMMRCIYAMAGIPAYWSVNLVDRQLEVFTEPSGPDYLTRKIYASNNLVPILVAGFEAGRIAVKELLP